MTLLRITLRTARRWLRPCLVAVALLVMAWGSACGSSPPAPTPIPEPPPGPNPPPGGTGVLVGAGDIAECANGVVSAGLIATTKLLEGLSGTVFAAGDSAYMDGTSAEYRDCYDPYWGRFKDRTWPVPGNHEYRSANGAPYFAYFGSAAGTPGQGYWRRTLGTWTVVGLNSEGNLSAQIQWLKSELGTPAGRTNCTLAIWHRPLFSAGNNLDATDMQETWQALADLGVDVVVNGHEHLYQRYDPQDANGNPDPRGMVQFTVGTGGASLSGPVKVNRNSAKIISYWGVAKFTLEENRYSWEFIPIDKGGGTDSGQRACRF